MATNSKNNLDTWSKTQTWAVVWFFSAILFGSCLTFFLSKTDFYLYKNNAETLNYSKYKENRKAGSSISKDSVDSRSFGSLNDITK